MPYLIDWMLLWKMFELVNVTLIAALPEHKSFFHYLWRWRLFLTANTQSACRLLMNLSFSFLFVFFIIKLEKSQLRYLIPDSCMDLHSLAVIHNLNTSQMRLLLELIPGCMSGSDPAFSCIYILSRVSLQIRNKTMAMFYSLSWGQTFLALWYVLT